MARAVSSFPQNVYIEPRWPVAVASAVGLLLLTVLPDRLRLFPVWVPFVVVTAFIVPMMALALTTAKARWMRIESVCTVLYLLISGVGVAISLKVLFAAMLSRTAGVSGMQLLSSSVAVWVTNVLMFSVAFWRIDRGGPEARANNANAKRDWTFPPESLAEDGAPAWRATYVDYLFLSFCTATAFSPTDALPLTVRAKLLMMSESVISLVTIVAVAARAINILGS